MSLYSYLNKESIVINKLIAFTQTPKFATLMELLMKSDIITTNERLYSTSQNRLTEITIYKSGLRKPGVSTPGGRQQWYKLEQEMRKNQ